MNWLMILIIIGIIITGVIVIAGVATMGSGGDFNRKYSNKLMRVRVIAQFTTLVLVVIYLFVYR